MGIDQGSVYIKSKCYRHSFSLVVLAAGTILKGSRWAAPLSEPWRRHAVVPVGVSNPAMAAQFNTTVPQKKAQNKFFPAILVKIHFFVRLFCSDGLSNRILLVKLPFLIAYFGRVLVYGKGQLLADYPLYAIT